MGNQGRHHVRGVFVTGFLSVLVNVDSGFVNVTVCIYKIQALVHFIALIIF